MSKDLAVLVADKDMENALRGLFSRHVSLNIRPIEFQIFTHSGHDPGCATRGVDYLSKFARQYEHALLMFDHEGSGKDDTPRDQLQNSLNQDLKNLWGDRARAIVLSPELEVWVWSDSIEVDHVAGWKGRLPRLRDWLKGQGLLREGEVKPEKPKEAFLKALQEADKPHSASLYREIAEKVSLRRCQDPSFQEFQEIMQEWFPKG